MIYTLTHLAWLGLAWGESHELVSSNWEGEILMKSRSCILEVSNWRRMVVSNSNCRSNWEGGNVMKSSCILEICNWHNGGSNSNCRIGKVKMWWNLLYLGSLAIEADGGKIVSWSITWACMLWNNSISMDVWFQCTKVCLAERERADFSMLFAKLALPLFRGLILQYLHVC